VLGLGGVFAETTPLHAAALLPLRHRSDFDGLVRRAGLAQLFVRLGDGVADAVCDIIDRVGSELDGGRLADLASIEINPLFATGDGAVLAADVLAVRRRPNEEVV
jgi:hypothetical protein